MKFVFEKDGTGVQTEFECEDVQDLVSVFLDQMSNDLNIIEPVGFQLRIARTA